MVHKRRLSKSSVDALEAPAESRHLAKKSRLEEPLQSQPASRTSSLQALHLPLTFENVHRLNLMSLPPPQTPRSGRESPTKSSSLKSGSNTSFKLQCFGVYHGRKTRRPASLQSFIDETILAPLDTQTPSSLKIASLQLAATLLSEQDGIDLLKEHLLPKPAMTAGERFVAICAKPNLNRDFVPLPISDAAASQHARLEQPQPDHAVGYIRNDIADAAQVEAPFTEAEEVTFRQLAVATDLHFPFLSCQWKSCRNGGTHYAAREQSARDGATIINATHQFFTAALSREPSVVETCHFSLTCDMESACLYVCWRNPGNDENSSPTYELQPIAKCWLEDSDDIWKIRQAIHNITQYSTHQRLQAIKTALSLTTNVLRRPDDLQTGAYFPARGQPASIDVPTPPTTAVSDAASGAGSRTHKRRRAEATET